MAHPATSLSESGDFHLTTPSPNQLKSLRLVFL